MNWQAMSFDWNQARAFLLTAEEGSLSAAARALGLTQPTVGRQVASLEESLGMVLFERIGKSLALTPSYGLFSASSWCVYPCMISVPPLPCMYRSASTTAGVCESVRRTGTPPE